MRWPSSAAAREHSSIPRSSRSSAGCSPRTRRPPRRQRSRFPAPETRSASGGPMPSVELIWALAAASLLLIEALRRRGALRKELRSMRGSYESAVARNEQLTHAADEMATLYRNELLSSRKRAARLKKVLEIATSINSNLALDKVLHEVVHAVADAAGFRIVLPR